MNDSFIEKFESLSDKIDFKHFERETRNILYLGFVFAVCFHAILVEFFHVSKHKNDAVKQIPINMLIIPIRKKEPFEIKQKELIQSPMSKKKKAMSLPGISINAPSRFSIQNMVHSLNLDLDTLLVASLETELSLPQVSFDKKHDIVLQSLKEPDNLFSMRAELIHLNDFDDGNIKGLAVRDPFNDKKIHGFVHIATTWGQQLIPPDNLLRSVIRLTEAVNKYTDIDAKVDSHLFLVQERLFEMPFVYIFADKAFELSISERNNLKEYFQNGGFAFIDNGTPFYEFGQAEASLRQMLRDALGADARFLPIPNNHPIYHSYFHFDDGPPLGSENQMLKTNTARSIIDIGTGKIAEMDIMVMNKPIWYLEGVWLKNRLVAVYSDKGYSHKWSETISGEANNFPQLKFGVNLIVFALTQKNGIAQRNMRYLVD